MRHMQDVKFLNVTPPAAIIDNASAPTASIDSKGYDYLTVVVQLGALDVAMTALKLQTSDADSGYADLAGAVYGTSTNIAGSTSALPVATDDNKFFVFEVDLRGKKRFFDLVATCGDGSAGTFISVFAILSVAENQLTTAAARGAADILRV